MESASYDTDETVIEEIEALKAILLNELDVKYNEDGCRPVEVTTTLHPATAENVDQRFVCVTLVLQLPIDYPDSCPIMVLRNPRGLSEELLNHIQRDCQAKCQDYKGCAVLYELIELVKEALTTSNIPHGQCPICLCDFLVDDCVSKTECYHHFHSHCLGTYIQHCVQSHKVAKEERLPWEQRTDERIICPVCRESITYDLPLLLSAPLPLEESNIEFNPSEELEELRRTMAALYLQQKAKGGIIDIEAEENRFLLFTGEPQEPADDIDDLFPLFNSELRTFNIPVAKPSNHIQNGGRRTTSNSVVNNNIPQRSKTNSHEENIQTAASSSSENIDPVISPNPREGRKQRYEYHYRGRGGTKPKYGRGRHFDYHHHQKNKSNYNEDIVPVATTASEMPDEATKKENYGRGKSSKSRPPPPPGFSHKKSSLTRPPPGFENS